MIDLSGRCVITASDEESGRLLKYAISLGYILPVDLEVMLKERVFYFNPSKTVTFTSITVGEINKYSDLFGAMEKELKDICELAFRFCKTYKCDFVITYGDLDGERCENRTVAVGSDGEKFEVPNRKTTPRQITMKEIEEKFGGPVEIVS